MREGQILRVKALAIDKVAIEGDGVRRTHDDHGILKIGDVLVAANDSAANGDALVTMPCGCARLLFAS